HRATSGEREIVARVLFVQRLEQREKRLLISCLDRSRNVLVLLLERLVRFSRRSEKIDQRPAIQRAYLGRAILPAVRKFGGVMPKISQAQPKTAVGTNAHD